MGPRASLDGCGKSRPTGIRSPNRPARSALLYLLHYSGPAATVHERIISTNNWHYGIERAKQKLSKNSVSTYHFENTNPTYCIVVGSWRIMPPDALQPKAYCTNPGLQSFLLATPGVSTRDPSSERRNYLGEKRPVISTEICDFHAYIFRFFYMPQICDTGQAALLPVRRKAY